MEAIKLAKNMVCVALVGSMALLSTACRKNSEKGSSYTYSEYYIEDDSVDNSTDGNGVGDNSGSGNNNDKNSNSANSNAHNSQSGKTDPGNSAKKNSTVKVLVWYDVPKRESSVADAFTKSKGYKVQFVKTSLNNYQTKLASLVASGSAPDCAAILGETYPSTVIRGLYEPLSSDFDLKNNIWDQGLIEQYKWSGEYYGVVAKGSMFGDMYCVYFNKTLFDERGEKTPYQIWKEDSNAWTWTKFREVAKSMTYGTGDNKKYGFSISAPSTFMLSTGKDFVNVSGNTIINTSNDGDVRKAWKFFNDMLDNDGTCDRSNSSKADLINRKAAMFVAGQWMMQSDNEFSKQMKDEWGVAPFPKADISSTYYVPFRVVLWGVGKGAKNSKGAAEFLKYWLNPANEVSNVYANEECREVHKWMWQQAKGNNFSEGVLAFGAPGLQSELISKVSGGSEKVDSELDSRKGQIDAAIKVVLGEIKS